MKKEYSQTNLQNVLGISRTEIGRILRDYGIFEEGEIKRKSEKYLLDDKAMQKIVVFYMYKSSQIVKNKKKNDDFIKEFKSKYNEEGPLKILAEISKVYKEVYHLFKESEEVNNFEEKINIYIKMIQLITINIESKLAVRDKIKKDILSIKGYEYDRVFKGEQITSLKFSPQTLDTIFSGYREAYSHYFEKNTLNDHEILGALQEQKTSFDLESKLLKEHREYFSFFKEKLGCFTYRELRENKNILENVKQEFYVMSKSKFEEILNGIYTVVKDLEIHEMNTAFEPIRKKKEKFSDSQKEFHRNLPLRNYSDMFMCIDEVFDFYNSYQGKLLNEYFKKHNLLVEFFEYIKQYTSYSNYYQSNLNDIKFSLTRDIGLAIRCLGYDYEYKYHMLHDAFELMKSQEEMEKAGITEDKLLESISKILSHGSFDINSYYQNGKLLKKAIATNNPKAVKVLNGYIDDVEEGMILSACYDQADTEGMIRSVLDCIPNTKINTKAYYQAIYEGDSKLVDVLVERVKPISKKYPIEMYLCIVGKNPKAVSNVLMNNIDKYPESEDFFNQNPTKEELKLSFIEISILWGREDIVKENINFLNSIDRDNYLLEKTLALLLRCNYVDTFKEIFEGKGFDSSRICYIFIDTDGIPSTEITQETWKYLLEDVFKDIDTNKIFSDTPSHCYRDHEATIEGLAKENFHFTYASMIFLEKLYKDTTKFKVAFKEVKESLEKNPKKTSLCYMGLNEEYEKNPEEYMKRQKEKLKMFEVNS